MMLRSGNLNARYLEIFGLIDMDELLKILQEGRQKLNYFYLFRVGSIGKLSF
jgi:hypothetical protein